MKTLLYYLIIGIFLSLSCKKAPLYNIYVYSGTINGLLINNNSWPVPKNWKSTADGAISPSGPGCQGGLGLLSIRSLTSENFIRESIAMSGLPLKTGKFVVTSDTSKCFTSPGASLFLSASDGDVLVGDYMPLSSAENSITIQSYNAASGDVSGSFDITFVKIDLASGYYTNYTDTVRFKGGQFHTKWIK
jgi:hypothetical protein